MKKTDLLSMVIDELKALAKKMKIVLPMRAKKAEIIDAIMTTGGAGKKADRKKTALEKAVAKNVTVKKSTVKKATAKKAAESKYAAKNAATGKVASKTTGKAKQSAAKKPAAAMGKIGAPDRTPGRGLPEPIIPIYNWKIPPEAEEPLLAQERAVESKYYTGPAGQQAAAKPGELPQGYGEDRIVLIARDPFVVHAYWEATAERLEREKAWFGWESKICIRIFDITGVQFDGRNAIGYFDQEVIERSGNWYLDLGRPGHSFCADLGLLSPEGRFFPLVRSNYITIPRDGVSDVVDEEWMLADEEFWKLYGYPEGFQAGPSSPRRALQEWEMMRRRRLQEISSRGLVTRERAKARRK
ncbi:MAG TPA: DUF4912 domain-containing protein [Nitrospirota bacterium]|nr:DUF4912 domain-containing protein [Nitrospirota bacterium]